MADTFDFKKEYKDLYLPKKKPSIIEVPPMNFIMVDGRGNPNEEGGEYANAMSALYSLSFTIKMSKMGDHTLDGYYEYVVPPLEGLWWLDDFTFTGEPINNKDEFYWLAMIRQPEFVTEKVFAWAKEEAGRKKPDVDLSKARFMEYTEGLSAHVMHIGPYDDEPATIAALSKFIHEQGYVENISDQSEPYPLVPRHHEIYLGDPRRTAPEKLRTVIRHPIRKA